MEDDDSVPTTTTACNSNISFESTAVRQQQVEPRIPLSRNIKSIQRRQQQQYCYYMNVNTSNTVLDNDCYHIIILYIPLIVTLIMTAIILIRFISCHYRTKKRRSITNTSVISRIRNLWKTTISETKFDTLHSLNSQSDNKDTLIHNNTTNNHNTKDDDDSADSNVNDITNHRRIQTMQRMKLDFIQRVGCDRYGYNNTPGGYIDTWRSKEFPSMIDPIHLCTDTTKSINNEQPIKEVYLDYTGAAIPTQSQMDEIIHVTKMNLLGNPHSTGPAAYRTKQYIEQVKQLILQHFHAHPITNTTTTTTTANAKTISNTTSITNQLSQQQIHLHHPGYEIIFTSGTTECMKIISQQFPWSCNNNKYIRPIDYSTDNDGTTTTSTCGTPSSSIFLYAQNSHTSVIGMREVILRQQQQLQDQEQQYLKTHIVGCIPADQIIETILHHTGTIEELNNEFRKVSINSTCTQTATQQQQQKQQQQQQLDMKMTDNTTRIRCNECMKSDTKHLLVLPLECNFGGDRYDSVETAFQKLYDLDTATVSIPTLNGEGSFRCHDCRCRKQQKQQQQQPPRRWYTMLDIAKAASTGPINLCQLNPDFACVSFYKMFGEPTGLGCLFVKRTAIDILFQSTTATTTGGTAANNNYVETSMPRTCNVLNRSRMYAGGGSVNIIVPGKDYTVPRSEPTPLISLANGTPHFRGIVALLAGFHELDRVGGINRVHQHTLCLAQEFVRRLQTLRHHNERRVVEVYGNWKSKLNNSFTERKTICGPTVAFNVIRADGSYVGYNEVSKLAALNNPPIQIRTGCFCNPGACQIALNISDVDLIRNFEESGHVCGDPIDIINNRPTGVVRVSFGKDSIWEDMNTFVTFIERMFINYETDNNSGLYNVTTGNSQIPNTVEITELYIFPIKSCAAQRVTDWQMDSSSGRLRFDREFALIDSSGVAMRLQMYPLMSLLHPTIDLKTSTLTVEPVDHSCPPLILNLDDKSFLSASDGQECAVKVCGNRCTGLVWGDYAVSDWFSRYLGVKCWLARHSGGRKEHYEYFDMQHIPQKISSSLSFANEQPLLLISEHAVQILNKAMQVIGDSSRTNVSSKQFRPNIVVRVAGFANRQVEDFWKNIILIDDKRQKCLAFDVIGPCARCAMVDIDPTDGCKVNTLRALAGYRRLGNGQITFGIFLRACLTAESERNVSNWFPIHEGYRLWCS